MPTYRVYLIEESGHISAPPKLLVCEHDEAAIEQAKQFVDGVRVEVWDGRKHRETTGAARCSISDPIPAAQFSASAEAKNSGNLRAPFCRRIVTCRRGDELVDVVVWR
jgi:hypothetical protein